MLTNRLIATAMAVTVALSAAAASPLQFARKAPAGGTGALAEKVDPTIRPNRTKNFKKGPRQSSSQIASPKRLARPTSNVLPALKAPLRLAAGTELYGDVIYSTVYQYSDHGIFQLTPTSGTAELTPVHTGEGFDFAAGTYGDGKFYGVNWAEFFGYIAVSEMSVFDTSDWATLETIEGSYDDYSSGPAFDVSYDDATGRIYGVFFTPQADSYIFGYYEPGTMNPVKISDIDVPMTAVAMSQDGIMYAIDFDGYMYAIDKMSGEVDFVGDTGIATSYYGSAVIDPRTGEMYWSANPADEHGYLYKVDTANAQATLLCQYPGDEQIVGLYIPAPKASMGAPAAVESIMTDFADGALAGTVSFDIPSLTFGGEPLAGDVAYTLTRDNEVISQAAAAAGSHISVADTVYAAANYTYSVICSNADGQSPATQVSLWIGDDEPVAPRSVNLAYADGKFTVEWSAVTAGVHQGFVPSDLTYTVALFSGEEKIAEVMGIDVTSAVIEFDAPAELSTYFCTVTAVTSAAASQTGISNTIAMGHAVPPYADDFDNSDSLASLTLINLEGGTYKWTLENSVLTLTSTVGKPMDDWIITPAVELKKGYQYTFYFTARAASEYTVETVEARMGNAPTVAALSTTIIEPLDLTSGMTLYRSVVTPAEDGEYYFAVHAISANGYRVEVGSIGVSEALSLEAPAAPTDLVVTPDKKSALKATVQFYAPTQTLSGGNTALNKIEILREGKLITTIENAIAGEKYVCEDTDVPVSGTYLYEVVAYNEAGKGAAAEANVYVGINIPARVQGVTMVETDVPGEVTLTWEPDTTDINGNYIAPENVTYTLIDNNNTIVARDIPETTFTYRPVTEGQDFIQVAVYATTIAGSSQQSNSPFMPVGAPYKLPYVDSFTDGMLEHAYAQTAPEGSYAQWNLYTDASFIEISDADGTNGFLGMRGYSTQDEATIYTARIDLDCEYPTLSFYHFVVGSDDNNVVKVAVTTPDITTPVEVAEIPMKGNPGVWKPALVALDEFAGQTVQIYLTGCTRSYGNLVIDRLKIAKAAERDLMGGAVQAPAEVKPGEEFDVTVDIFNLGMYEAEDYSVDLYRNDELVATQKGTQTIDPGYDAVVTFKQTLTPLAEEENTFTAKIVYEGDEDTSNNASASAARVIVVMQKYPVASDLVATAENGVKLTWQAPDMSSAPLASITDDFESYTPFAHHNVGDWTLVDEDGMPVSGDLGVDGIGDIVFGESAIAFYVMNIVEANLANNPAHSGDQYMVSTYLADGLQSSDWMISPELSGRAQTISLFAKSGDARYYETFRVLYSSTDRELSSFSVVDEFTEENGKWTEYQFDVPDGAKFFAIQCVSQDRYVFFVDDVTYSPAGAQPVDLTLTGYNVYRNGVKIATVAGDTTAYTDADGKAGDVYVVTSVYAEGESPVSNEAKLETSGIVSATVNGMNVGVESHTIVVENAGADVKVYSVDGREVYAADAALVHKVNVVGGVYIVASGTETVKVAVK